MNCPSQRIVNGETVQCRKRYGHPDSRHKGIMADLTTIEWTGAPGYMCEGEAVGT